MITKDEIKKYLEVYNKIEEKCDEFISEYYNQIKGNKYRSKLENDTYPNQECFEVFEFHVLLTTEVENCEYENFDDIPIDVICGTHEDIKRFVRNLIERRVKKYKEREDSLEKWSKQQAKKEIERLKKKFNL